MPKQVDKGKGKIIPISRDPKEKDRQVDPCENTVVNTNKCHPHRLDVVSKEPLLPELENDQRECPTAVDSWVSVEKREKRLAPPPASLTGATTPLGTAPDLEGGIPAKVAVQVDGQLADAELQAFLSRFGHVRGTKDCIKEGGTFVFFSSIDPRNLEKLLGKHTIQGKRAIVFPQDRYKTLVCKNWENFSQCPRGDLCDFAHGTHELRPPPADPGTSHDTANGSAYVQKPPLVAHQFAVLGPDALLPPSNADVHLRNASRRPKGPSLGADSNPEVGHPMQGLPGHPKHPHHPTVPTSIGAARGPPPADDEMDFLAKFGLLTSSPEATEKRKPKKGAGKGAGGGELCKGDVPQTSQDKKFSLFYY